VGLRLALVDDLVLAGLDAHVPLQDLLRLQLRPLLLLLLGVVLLDQLLFVCNFVPLKHFEDALRVCHLGVCDGLIPLAKKIVAFKLEIRAGIHKRESRAVDHYRLLVVGQQHSVRTQVVAWRMVGVEPVALRGKVMVELKGLDVITGCQLLLLAGRSRRSSV